ncbi:cohesin subunit SA-3 isoform X1 [Xenopus tropicalis]|uniref:Cohesin subunit SA n=1 Tax=Xenopus tropicalis TaxID=8364 RepID=A0A6I8RR30_XENTR|nr:cohesin subunit SA-3 isoform X1 [Xenopus tropicalis]
MHHSHQKSSSVMSAHGSSSIENSPHPKYSGSSPEGGAPYLTPSSVASEGPVSQLASEQRGLDETPTVLDIVTETDESISDEGSDFEETLSKRPRRASPGETVAAKRPRIAEETVCAKDLFEAIRMGRSAMHVLVDDWLDSYKQDREAALLELINFLMLACGCNGVVTLEMLENMQNSDIIRKMTMEFNEETPDYPLLLSTKPWKKFHANFGDFFKVLVNRCQYNIIYDELLMDALISLLTGLSDSQVRAFRHTSTFAAVKLMSGLVKVAWDVSHHLNTTKRQFVVEHAKSPETRSPERLEALLAKQRGLQGNLEEVVDMMNGIFKGVFVHRYCDTSADIRAICMEEIGVWMRTYSQSFLSDSCLKYVGWTLYDKQGAVRLQCIRTLHSLYSVPEMAPKLELFTSRFKNRMVFMVLDKEQQVAVEAIKLIGLISQNMEDMLSKKDCDTIYPFVFVSSRAVSSAAGAFLYQRVLAHTVAETSPKGRNRLGNVSFFRLLMSFFIKSKLPEHAAYLVDSLWECAGAPLQDWVCQTDLLLLEEEGLDDTDESALIEILVASMRQAVEGTSPVGRVPARRAFALKDRKAEDKSRLTRHMILALPPLLAKFSADSKKVRTLLKITSFMELEIYCTDRMEKFLDTLLAEVQEILEKHTEEDVLESCSRALYILCDRKQALYQRADIARSTLMDRLTGRFLQQVPEIMQETEPDEDAVYNIAATMKRISPLYSGHDLSHWELFGPCSQILLKGMDTGEVPEQIVMAALTCCHFSLLWELFHISNSKGPQNQISPLKQKLRQFCDICQGCLSDLNAAIRKQAFVLLSDLLVIFGSPIAQEQRFYLQPLAYRPSLSLQAELAGFLLDNVFTDPEEENEARRTETLHERRNLLAGYCKLILYSSLQLHSASDIFRHYVKFNASYGDLIKETLHKCRSISREETTKTVLLSLTQAFTELCQEGDSPPQRSSRPFLEIRGLARRLALLYGPDQRRYRQDIVLLHKEGIKYCLRENKTSDWSPQNLLFLDVLSEFSHKTIKEDKKALLRYLEETTERCLPSQPVKDNEIWAPFLAYRKSLCADEESPPSTESDVSPRRVGTKRSTPRPEVPPQSKRRRGSIGTLDISSLMIEEGKPRLPLMTSTQLKEQKTRTLQEEERSETDYEPSQLSFPRIQRTPSSRPCPQARTPATVISRLSLMEEEEEDEYVIQEDESSEGSAEYKPDLFDSALYEEVRKVYIYIIYSYIAHIFSSVCIHVIVTFICTVLSI